MGAELVDLRPVLAPVVSALCAALVMLVGYRPRWRAGLTLAAPVLKFAVVWSMLPGALAGTTYRYAFGEILPGLAFAFRVDALGLFFALVSSTLWIAATVYALAYMRGKPGQQRFFGFFALCVSTTVGIAFAENLMTLFVFYELLTVCTYPLLMHDGGLRARRAGRRYLVYTLSGGAAILAGMLLVWHHAGTMSLAETGILGAVDDRSLLLTIFVLFATGFAVKAAVMPLHAWLPAAMVAPVPVSALLHAVAVVKAGAFGLLRLIYNVFGVELMRELGYASVLAIIAGATILLASLVALRQQRLKALLAWSTISQLSYIVLAACLLTPAAALAAIIHLANQAFAKITLFFAAGAIERATGKTRLDELDGIGRRMPLVMGAFTVACLSFIGVPLFAGFITKWYLSLGALQAGAGGFVALLALSALLNALYWLPVVFRAFFRPADRTHSLRPVSWLMRLPIVVCAAYVILLGVGAEAPAMPFVLAKSAVRFAFGMQGVAP
ncbi:MAG: proton-conducting transporter membrane subunit [Wenzhouxiangellaceae bacterium]|nr:proton-conducting transporter membrane subunit [Wenzhouxiangellaceae bacterium]